MKLSAKNIGYTLGTIATIGITAINYVSEFQEVIPNAFDGTLASAANLTITALTATIWTGIGSVAGLAYGAGIGFSKKELNNQEANANASILVTSTALWGMTGCVIAGSMMYESSSEHLKKIFADKDAPKTEQVDAAYIENAVDLNIENSSDNQLEHGDVITMNGEQALVLKNFSPA